MRITASDYYYLHSDCDLWECVRLYCKRHRLIYRLCESATDYADDGKLYTGECTRCHEAWEMKHERELMERHHASA